MERCSWANTGNELLKEYHDQEWGMPCHDEHKLFELLSLEIMQAGLSWQTVLNKRAAFKTAFADFDVKQVQNFQAKLPQLMVNKAIIRNQRKLLAIINNAQVVVKLAAAGTCFNDYMWQFVDYQPIVHQYQTHTEVPSTNGLAKKISQQMKRDGFQFAGPVITYSFLQAAGLINDHVVTCFRHQH
ncbi:DNA-3-methyladenine glycosylase I [Liquorilactobacillus satsumensis]|uniref:DNA-3-methyladenine glycosylase I n=1 Tax=Liquorilactobacillus satsumensis DSM 16230 = JCM 12392 TaxID=1423801 RepID=A0A0R1V446_9LACO|nr:DNA-3-methyladenine glycosylase I [Liquorilactobacillus satsumensis]KRM00295.1 DNA-3-methyladenine glycosylase I [Liquorilactobacillus satsumensis DSM 16230 = JCM 12392]